MAFNKIELGESLASAVREIILDGEKLKALTLSQFNQKRSDGGWSVAQVIAHLNFYSDFYLPLLEKADKGNQVSQLDFHPGWLGNYFTKLMAPDSRGAISKKMKSPANATPHSRDYALDSLEKFLGDQQRLLNVLKDINRADLNSRLPISISKLIRLKMGDVLRFVVAHEQRHFVQINGLLKEL